MQRRGQRNLVSAPPEVGSASRRAGRRRSGPAAARAIGVAAVEPQNPRPFHRPLSASPGWKVVATRAEMDRLVAVARRCPPGAFYAGPPLVAFLARRHVPADQPDVFIVSRAKLHAAVFKRLLADGPRCP